MTDFSNFNNQVLSFEPITLIDEASSDEFYIGTSINGRSTSRPTWKIKKIWKDGNIWRVEFPNGDQSYTFIWNDRATGYTYS